MSAISSSVTGQSTGSQWSQHISTAHPEFAAYQKEVRDSILALLTPLNLTVIVILFTVIYLRLRAQSPTASIQLPPHQATTFRTFTPRTLLPFSGHKSEPHNPDGKVYLSVKGKVYDVSNGRNFYGPGGPYENFAGRDATRGLACQSFDEEMLTKNLDGPLDDCADLDADALENLRGWEERFDEKYLIVGKLIAFDKSKSPW